MRKLREKVMVNTTRRMATTWKRYKSNMRVRNRVCGSYHEINCPKSLILCQDVACVSI